MPGFYYLGNYYDPPGPPPAGGYADLVAAVVARLRATPAVVAALGEVAGRPKVFSDEATGSPAAPWLVVNEAVGTRQYLSEGCYIERGQLDLSVFSNGKLASRQIGELLADPAGAGALDDPPLSWSGARLMKLRLRNQSFAPPLSPGVGAALTYHRVMTFEYWFSGSLV